MSRAARGRGIPEDLTHHAKLGLGLLQQALLFRLGNADEDANFWVEL